jgi:hypothetical protein
MVLKGSSAGPIIRLNARVKAVSAANSADAEIGGLIVGTSDHQGTAANSLVLSNITTDGDIQMLVSDNGDSKEFLFANGDTANLVLGHGMATTTIKTASGDLTLAPGGDIDLDDNNLLNVGASGSDWDTTSLRNAGDYFGVNDKSMVIGHSALVSVVGGSPTFQVVGDGPLDPRGVFVSYSTSRAPGVILARSRNATIGSHTILNDNDVLGDILFAASDDADLGTLNARMQVKVDDSSPAASDIAVEFILALSDGLGADNLIDRLTISPLGITTLTSNLILSANNGGSLGISGTAWSDLFLADGGVIDWNAGELTLTQTNTVLAFAGGTFNPTGGMDAVGNAGSSLAADAWTMSSANVNTMKIETTGASNHALFDMHIPASGSGLLQIRLFQGVGNGDANNMRYTLGYNAGSAIFQIESQDIDGSSTAGDVLTIADGTNDVTLAGGLSTGGATPPTAGLLVGSGNIKSNASVDSSATADQVAFGRYEIGAGNTVIALSQETAVATETDETKFSHKVQVRFNGATYFIMMTAT